MHSRRITLIAAAMAALGCGGSGGGGTSVSADDFPTRFADGWCGLLLRCCQASGGAAMGACEADIAASSVAIGVQAAAGGATWDASAAGRCLDAIAHADCGATNAATLRDLLDSCDDTWRGVIPPGGACQTYAACAEPAVSAGASGGASCVNSVCVQVVRQPAGATCNGTTMTCDPFAGACVSGTCTALPGPGQACTGSCSPGSRCTANVCVSLLAFGATCAADNECQSDRCRGGRCASTFVETEYCTLP